jgi:hypothetical protein
MLDVGSGTDFVEILYASGGEEEGEEEEKKGKKGGVD